MQPFIIYALIDPRTHRIRYIGKSAKGIIRALSHRDYQHSARLGAWLLDLHACKTEYVTIVLAETDSHEHLAALEAHWINVGLRSGWPLINQHIPETKPLLPSATEVVIERTLKHHRQMKTWRNDPEVKAALAEARLKPLNRKGLSRAAQKAKAMAAQPESDRIAALEGAVLPAPTPNDKHERGLVNAVKRSS